MFFLCSSKRTYQAGEHLDPFLVAHDGSPLDPFIFPETELEIFPGGFEVAIELQTGQFHHQADFAAGFQARFERIEKLLVFLASDFATEVHYEASFSGLV